MVGAFRPLLFFFHDMKEQRHFVEHALVGMRGFHDNRIGVFLDFHFFVHRKAFSGEYNDGNVLQTGVSLDAIQYFISLFIWDAHVEDDAIHTVFLQGFDALRDVRRNFRLDIVVVQEKRQRLCVFRVVFHDEHLLRFTVDDVLDPSEHFRDLLECNGFVQEIHRAFQQAFLPRFVRRHDVYRNMPRHGVGFQFVHDFPT